MKMQPIMVKYRMDGCPLNPLYKDAEVDRNRPPSLTECRLCQFYNDETNLSVACTYGDKK